MSSFSTDYQRKFHVAYIGRKWGFDYAFSTDQIVELCGEKRVYHNYVNGIFSLPIGNFGFIICHPDLEELLKCVILIHELKA